MTVRAACFRNACAVGGLLVLGVCCPFGPSRADGGGMTEFVQQVTDLARELAPIPSWKGLGYSPEFISMTANYRIHIDDCIAYLSEQNHSMHNRHVAIITMSRLNLDDDIVFVRRLLTLYDRGAIRDYELANAVTPNAPVYPTVLFENYADPAVQSLYDDILKRPGIEERRRKFIEWSRNGGDLKFKIKKWVHALGLD